MVRTRGLTYTCIPRATIGQRIDDIRVNSNPVEADKRYRLAGWASVKEAESTSAPVWEPLQIYLRNRKTIRVDSVNVPKLL